MTKLVGDVAVRMLQSRGHGFDSRSGHYQEVWVTVCRQINHVGIVGI